MTYSPTFAENTTRSDGVRRQVAIAAVSVLVASSALTVYGAHDLAEILVVLAGITVTMIGVYGFLLPRKLAQGSGATSALVLSVIAMLVLLPAFWSGLPLVLGVAGAMLGHAGRNAESGSRRSVGALVLGIIAAIGYFAIYVLDTLSQAGIM